MRRISKFLCMLSGLALILLIGTSCSPEEDDDTQSDTQTAKLEGSYSIHVGGYDWGPGVDQAIIEFDQIIDEFPKEEIMVEETKEILDPDDYTLIIEETFEREITDVYYVDEEGEKSNEPTKFLAFDLYVSPEEGNPFIYNVEKARNAWTDPYYLTFSLKEGETIIADGEEVTELDIEQDFTEKVTAADPFDLDSYETSDGTNYNYATFTPEEETDTLFVWLHGGGEGEGIENTDATIPLLANKATALAENNFQESIGNAHLLVPQSPTMWLDEDGENTMTTDGTSYYDESLKELIDFYKEETNTSKVILAGPSNGGYMVLRLAVLYPEEYDMLIPICEGYADDELSDAELEAIKDIPMFFIYSEDDDTLVPEEYTIPTVERLEEMDAAELKVSSTETVIDTSGEYQDEAGEPYQYDGHWSWIYFYNNEALSDDDDTPVFNWIQTQLPNN